MFIIPCMDSVTVVDLRAVSFDVSAQEILTRASVTVSVDAVIYFNMENAMATVCKVVQYVDTVGHLRISAGSCLWYNRRAKLSMQYGASTRLPAWTTLRTVMGTRSLQQLLEERREDIAKEMQDILDETTNTWGIKMQGVEVKDLRLPGQMQRAMASEAEADREARAKVVAAEGEKLAALSLKEASDIIDQSSSALQLRYLQTLNTIAAEQNSTIIFPIPLDMLGVGRKI